MKKILYKHRLAWVVSSLCLLLTGCANRGIGPQGGPKDTIPPVVVKETPANGSNHFKDKKIEILFNEYLQLDNVQANLLVSPPQQVPPDVKAQGKKVVITMQEDLIDSTTYTLDFGNSICDYTEKNPIRGYQYAFTTGDRIDSLEVYGQVINAEDLNPPFRGYWSVCTPTCRTRLSVRCLSRVSPAPIVWVVLECETCVGGSIVSMRCRI